MHNPQMMSYVLDLAALTEVLINPSNRRFEGWELQDAAERVLGKAVTPRDLEAGIRHGTRCLVHEPAWGRYHLP